MKIKYDEQRKKTRPCTFADVPVGGVFKDASGWLLEKLNPTAACALNNACGEVGEVDYKNNQGDCVTYYPDATLHMGRAVTEMPCD